MWCGLTAFCNSTKNVLETDLTCLYFLFFFAVGCARQWCLWRTLLSQKPPPHCRNGASCGSSSMWSVAVYYITSHSYQNKTQSNKCEGGSSTTEISRGDEEQLLLQRNCIHCCFICILFQGLGKLYFKMLFFLAHNSTPGINSFACKSTDSPGIWPKHTATVLQLFPHSMLLWLPPCIFP